MGWKPNPLASAYMAHLRSTHPPSFQAVLGLLMDMPIVDGKDLITNDNLKLVHRGFAQRAAEFGYGVNLLNLRVADNQPSIDQIMTNRNFPGFAISGLAKPGKINVPITWSRYASVAMGYSMTQPPLHRVGTNLFHGFGLVFKKAFELGYRRIGVAISQEYDQRTNHGVLYPAYYTNQTVGPDRSIKTLVYKESRADVIKLVAHWIRDNDFDFVVGNYVFEALDVMGWQIPRDIAAATFDRSVGFPHHAGLDQCHEATGALAADVIIGEITRNRRGIPDQPVEHTIQGKWVDGPTAPPVTARSGRQTKA